MNTSDSPTATLLTWLDRHRHWLWLAIGLLLLASFNGQWRIGPDSAIHVTTARNLALGEGFTHPTGLQNTIRPGLALTTAATFRLFGIDSFVAIDAFMLACAVVVLLLTFWIVRLRIDRPTAVLVVCMLAANETFYRYGYQVLTDMPFLLGLMLMLLGLELFHRGKSARVIGILLMLGSVFVMAAFRNVVLTVLAAGVLAFVYRMIVGPKRGLYATVVGGGLIVLFLTIWLAGGASLVRDSSKVMSLVDGGFSQTLQRVFIDNGPMLLTEYLPEAVFGADLGPWAGTVAGATIIILGLGLFRLRPMWGLLVIVFIVQWLLAITNKRYVLVLIPLLALGWWQWVCWLETRSKPTIMPWVAIGLLSLWFGPNLVRISKFVIEQRTQPFLTYFENGRYAALSAVADELKNIACDGDVILADDAPQLTYLSGLPIYGAMNLPTYGEARRNTRILFRQATRILMVRPADDLLQKTEMMKLNPEVVLAVITTPQTKKHYEYEIVQMHWELAINGRRSWRNRALSETGRASQQTDSDTEQKASESKQPSDLQH